MPSAQLCTALANIYLSDDILRLLGHSALDWTCNVENSISNFDCFCSFVFNQEQILYHSDASMRLILLI